MPESFESVKGRKIVNLNFHERFNWDKARKNKNKYQNIALYLPLIDFFTQSSRYQIWKSNTYSTVTNGSRTCTASVVD